MSTTTYQSITGTGITSGVDTSEMIDAILEAYQTKIDSATQDQDLLEIQLEKYEEIQSSITSFYDKWCSATSSSCLLLSATWNNVSYTSGDSTVVSATTSGGAEADNYSVYVAQTASAAKVTLKDSLLTTDGDYSSLNADEIEITIDGETVSVDISSCTSYSAIVTALNNALSDYGYTASYSQLSQGIKITSDEYGSDQSISVTVYSSGKELSTLEGTGTNLVASIVGTDGTTYEISDEDGVTSNSLTLDSITFKFVSANTTTTTDDEGNTICDTSGAGTSLTGTVDASEILELLEEFIEEYNDLLLQIQTLYYEDYDSDYEPLTDSDKEDMSDDEIELWNEKVEDQSLSHDTTLRRIMSALKSIISSVTTEDGYTLSSTALGLALSTGYGTASAGTISISDEDTLLDILENSIDTIKDLFQGDNGIIAQIKTFYNGYASSTNSSSTLQARIDALEDQIDDYDEKIDKLQDQYDDKQDYLTTKYANMESKLTTLNAQYAALSSMFSS